MLLLLPILVPLIGGIFVFRQKNETYRDWLVVTLIVITAVMVLANCTMPTQRLWLLTIALSTVLNALYYVPALLAIWVKPPAEDEALVLADVHPGDLAADRAFTAAAAILIVGIFVLGIFYHPITDLIEAGVRLI